MDLEADLGIDSIKRVEILAAVRERAPGLPEVEATELGRLRTLGQIVEHMRALPGAPASHSANGHAGPAAPEPPRAAREPAAAAVDLEALLMSVVADKTGYPAEMLGGAHGPGGGPGDRLDQAGRDPGGLPRARAGAARGGGHRAGAAAHAGADRRAHARLAGRPRLASVERPRTPAAHAVEAGAAAPASAAPAIARRALREVPAPAVGLAPSGLHDASEVVVTEDGGGLAALVVEELGRHGVKARVASEVPPGAGAVIFLGGLREVGSIDDAIAVDREAFHAARAVAARFEAEGGLFVTVQDTGGDFGLSGRAGVRAWSGGALRARAHGRARVAARLGEGHRLRARLALRRGDRSRDRRGAVHRRRDARGGAPRRRAAHDAARWWRRASRQTRGRASAPARWWSPPAAGAA